MKQRKCDVCGTTRSITEIDYSPWLELGWCIDIDACQDTRRCFDSEAFFRGHTSGPRLS